MGGPLLFLRLGLLREKKEWKRAHLLGKRSRTDEGRGRTELDHGGGERRERPVLFFKRNHHLVQGKGKGDAISADLYSCQLGKGEKRRRGERGALFLRKLVGQREEKRTAACLLLPSRKKGRGWKGHLSMFL